MRIVFDFDGGVANTMPLIADAASGIVNKRFGTPIEIAEEWYWRTAGLPFAEQLAVLDNQMNYDMTTKQLMESTIELHGFVNMIYDVAEPWPDAHPAFEALDYGMHLVSATSSQLVSRFVYKWFPEALESVEPESKLYALQRIVSTSKSTKKVLYIGDMPNDKKVADIVGADFIGIDRGRDLPWTESTKVAAGLMEALEMASV
jgi:phosphoglycolate phosphatase-like HAD superfamily hydrolase